MTKTGCSQQREVVGGPRRITDMGCFYWSNTILGNLKTAISGTCHAVDFDKYAHLVSFLPQWLRIEICKPGFAELRKSEKLLVISVSIDRRRQHHPETTSPSRLAAELDSSVHGLHQGFGDIQPQP